MPKFSSSANQYEQDYYDDLPSYPSRPYYGGYRENEELVDDLLALKDTEESRIPSERLVEDNLRKRGIYITKNSPFEDFY